ncbi:hypothetical protein Pelo_11973 [Pelomyxa schiedti]|nr:hypothetical protein Pelo_11973 [Pelomyxa schiedti]
MMMVEKASEILSCCINLVEVLPQFAHDLCDPFVSKLNETYEPEMLTRLLEWLNGWDVLPLHASNELVESLKQSNITTGIITNLLQVCKRITLQEVTYDLVIPNELKSVTTLFDYPEKKRLLISGNFRFLPGAPA